MGPEQAHLQLVLHWDRLHGSGKQNTQVIEHSGLLLKRTCLSWVLLNKISTHRIIENMFPFHQSTFQEKHNFVILKHRLLHVTTTSHSKDSAIPTNQTLPPSNRMRSYQTVTFGQISTICSALLNDPERELVMSVLLLCFFELIVKSLIHLLGRRSKTGLRDSTTYEIRPRLVPCLLPHRTRRGRTQVQGNT